MAWAEEHHGAWRGVYRDTDGRKRYTSDDGIVNSFPTRKLAVNWARDQEAAIRAHRWHDPDKSKLLCGLWIERWWGDFVHTIEDTTRTSLRSRIDRYWLPKWSDKELGSITTTAVQAWATSLRKDGLAEWSVTGVVGMFSTCLQAAVAEDLLVKNPCSPVKLIRPRHTSVDVDYTPEQLDLICEEMAEPWDLLTAMLAWTGLRWGEMAGLHVRNVDLMRARIMVRETFIETHPSTRYIKGYPKDEDRRVVPIPDHILPRLSGLIAAIPDAAGCGWEHRERQTVRACPGGPLLWNCWFRGNETEPAGFVSRNAYRRTWRAAIASANRGSTQAIPYGRPYDLRHFYGTQLAEQGVSIYDIMLLMGHSDVETAKRYLPKSGIASHHDRALAALRSSRAALGGRSGGEHASRG